MANQDIEIVVEDPTAPEENSPAVTDNRTVEATVMVLLFALAVLLGWDNWRTGASWDETGPQAGYFRSISRSFSAAPRFMAWSACWRSAASRRKPSSPARSFAACCRCSCRRFLFCFAMQWLGLYVASFLLIAGFMAIIGKIAWWKSLLTAFIFVAIMFVTFDVAFDVIMPKGPLEAAFGR